MNKPQLGTSVTIQDVVNYYIEIQTKIEGVEKDLSVLRGVKPTSTSRVNWEVKITEDKRPGVQILYDSLLTLRAERDSFLNQSVMMLTEDRL